MTDHILDTDEMHERFKEQFKYGDPAVDETCKILRRWGLNPIKLRSTLADKHKDRMEHRDKGDIEIEIRGNKEIVESKRHRVDFTCEQDFPYRLVMVDRVFKFDSKPKRPLVYFFWDDQLTHIILIPVSETIDHWTTLKFRDPITTQVEVSYMVPKELVTYWRNPYADTNQEDPR